MKIWKNTKTLDDYSEGLIFTEVKEEAEIALLGGKSLDLDEFPNLKAIFRAGVSKNNVPEVEASKRNIICMYPSEDTLEYIYDETASFTCSIIMKMLYSNKGTLDPWVKFDRPALKDQQLLVIGQGKIGKKVADKMSVFLNVIRFDIVNNDISELEEMIKEADCISLHIPMSDDNEAFFGKARLELMKDGAVLVNTARGAVVDEKALYDEIQNNRLKAAFDVFWEEPYTGKLKKFHPSQFNMTPHIASTCSGFLKGCSKDLKELINELSN